jgi:uncharacterized protein YuzE
MSGMQPVQISVEASDDGLRSIYVTLADAPAFGETKTLSESPLVNVDYAGDGTVLGIEIIA